MLEPDDHYRNIYNGCTLPHDSIVFGDDEEALAELSGEVVPYNIDDLEDDI